jgi:hypothetical protein
MDKKPPGLYWIRYYHPALTPTDWLLNWLEFLLEGIRKDDAQSWLYIPLQMKVKRNSASSDTLYRDRSNEPYELRASQKEALEKLYNGDDTSGRQANMYDK